MTNDPGRQHLEDQIQCNGFLFLEDYIDGILAGPKQHPIIELIKTPGRKKDVPKRTRAATAAAAKAKAVTSMSLEDDDTCKENLAPSSKPRSDPVPVNKFHKALLQSKARSEYDPISEGDESSDRSGANTTSVPPQVTAASSRPSRPTASARNTNNTSNSAEPNSPVQEPTFTGASNLVPAPLAPETQSHPTYLTPIRDDEREEPMKSDQETTSASRMAGSRQPSVPHFPTIGAPSPLRKSVRAPREPSLAAAAAPPVVPTMPPQNVTRSSWLVKAREAKAVAEKRVSSLDLTALNFAGGAVKRKSGDMLSLPHGELLHQDGGERKTKVGKITEESSVADTVSSKREVGTPMPVEPQVLPIITDTATPHDDEPNRVATMDIDDVQAQPERMMERLKRTVEGFSARAGKSMGKSLGGAAAAALAEARAAAEARVAERNAAEGRSTATVASPAPQEEPSAPTVEQPPIDVVPQPLAAPANRATDAERRLSVSDLVSAFEVKKDKAPERVFQPPPPQANAMPSTRAEMYAANTSTSTTPPNSPPPVRQNIFSAPPVSSLQPAPTFFLPPSQSYATDDHLLPGPASLAPRLQTLSTHSTFVSTQSSTMSEAIFERDHEIPAWLPSTQDSEYSNNVGSQPIFEKLASFTAAVNADDDDTGPGGDADESWHLDENFTKNQPWAPTMGLLDDSMTWSTDPAQSQRGDTGPMKGNTGELVDENQREGPEEPKNAPGNPNFINEPAESDMELDELEIKPSDNHSAYEKSQSVVSLVGSQAQSQSMHTRSNSQTSVSKSQLSFLGAASKLVSSVLGGSKKANEPVKSLQLAAAAAKKQQDEMDKKATRLKEMEARRQQVLQKKAEEEKAREDKRVKEDNERRKREREETTEKRTLRQPTKKVTQSDDDAGKKRKVVEAEKKPEVQKPPSKDKKDLGSSRIGKPGLNSSQIASGSSNAGKMVLKKPSSSILGMSSTVKLVASTLEAKAAAGAAGGSTALPKKGKGKAKDDSLSGRQPSQVINAQMQARVQAQLEEIRKAEQTAVDTANIELPDINSEYSDSDDEDRVRTFDPPGWAQSPELREALQSQSTVNPDDIFGAIRPLRMEELFKARTSRFRARTSSANWAGTDRLTAAEEREYAKRMGYTS